MIGRAAATLSAASQAARKLRARFNISPSRAGHDRAVILPSLAQGRDHRFARGTAPGRAMGFSRIPPKQRDETQVPCSSGCEVCQQAGSNSGRAFPCRAGNGLVPRGTERVDPGCRVRILPECSSLAIPAHCDTRSRLAVRDGEQPAVGSRSRCRASAAIQPDIKTKGIPGPGCAAPPAR